MHDYIFADITDTLSMVEGAYKKLKSYLYYDKTLVFSKLKLAQFESNREYFEKGLNAIANALNSKDTEYFLTLIESIDYRVLPKKFSSIDENENIIDGSADHNRQITRVNFFIDMPIELHIIDFLWTILVGKIISNDDSYFKYSAATRFKNSLYNNRKDLYKGIDFESNRAFEPYFNLYSSWRNKAFNIIKDNHKDTDLILLCLDLKSFYYSVEFEFKNLSSYINDDRLNRFSFLTSLIETIYTKYTKMLFGVKKGILKSDCSCIFPIGVLSVYVLRELYLNKMDLNIVETIKPLYYNRYVDDILIVLKEDIDNSVSRETILKKYFVNNNLVTSIKNNTDEIKINGYNNIRLQKEKINCFLFRKSERLVLLDVFEETLKQNSSEANLLPDIDVLSSSFTNNAYTIKNLDLSNKIRDLGLVQNNNYQATKYINALLQLFKNTDRNDGITDKYFDQIEEFYKGSQCLEYSNSWRSLFELYLITGESKRGNSFYSAIRDSINSISLEHLNDSEINKKHIVRIRKKLIHDLKGKLIISAALASSLDPSFLKRKKVIPYAQFFRNSNLLNHGLVSYPLLNYSNYSFNSLVEEDLSILHQNSNTIFKLDSFKIKWSPRFIHTGELFIAKFLKSTLENKRVPSTNVDKALTDFSKYNSLYYLDNDNILYVEGGIDKTIKHYNLKFNNYSKVNPKVAVVNTRISEQDAVDVLINSKGKLTVENKLKIFNAINIAKQEKVDYLVFPEFYMPVQWLYDISKFALQNGISIITGLQYILVKNTVHNNLCVASPMLSSGYFNYGLIEIREKNYYAPKEKYRLAQLGYKCFDAITPAYHIFNNGKYRFSTILCYEFTDIQSRASFKSKTEVLFVPQLNKDTNYFSSIVESSARDLHAFVVQANTSLYGDSRITAPYNTQNKNILQIKGGETDVVMIGIIPILDLTNRRKKYLKELKLSIDTCLNCNKSKNSRNHNYCKSCSKRFSDNSIIKGTPPNFKN